MSQGQDFDLGHFDQALRALESLTSCFRASGADLFWAVRDATASVRSARFMFACEPGTSASSFRPFILQACALADQFDAMPDTFADLDLIVEASASLRLLCCLLDVDGADAGTGQAQRRTVTGAALATPPHGNHGDNLQ